MDDRGQYSPLASPPRDDAVISDTELLDFLALLVSPPSSPAAGAATPSLSPSSASWTSSSSPAASVSSVVSLEDARAERQRVRVRMKAQRAYRRKTARLQQLRSEVEELERQLKQLDQEQQDQGRDESYSSATGPLDSTSAIATSCGLTVPKTREEIEAQLAAAWKFGARLRQENNELRRQFMAMSGFTATVGELLSEEYKPYIAVASHLLFLRPLTPPECLAIHQRSMAVVRAFSPSAMLSSPQTRQVAGWREQREVVRGLFRYALQKRFFRCGSAATLATKSFLLLTEPAQMRRFYSDALNMEMRLVQKVDDDNYVVFQEMRATDAGGGEYSASKSLLLVSRAQIGGSHGIYLYGLKQDELPVAERHLRISQSDSRFDLTPEFWSTQFCWIQFEDVEGAGEGGGKKKGSGSEVVVSYAGITPTVSATTAFWLVEVVLHCLRWEQILVGPWVHLTSSN